MTPDGNPIGVIVDIKTIGNEKYLDVEPLSMEIINILMKQKRLTKKQLDKIRKPEAG